MFRVDRKRLRSWEESSAAEGIVQSTSYDAIVVGSGISGGWAAKELTEKGLRVLLLERGKNIEHIKDYVNATKGPWEYPHRGGRTRAMELAYPVLKRDFPLNEKNLDWWASDEESPYTEVKRFDWYRGYHVGGRSLMWGRCSFRWSDLDYEANVKQGLGTDWPIRYADIEPWYSHVEKFAGIAGSREGLPQLPDGEFQPAMALNCAEQLVADRLTTKFDGKRRLISARTANLSLKPWAIVNEVLYDRNTKRATGVRVLDGITNEVTDYKAKVVFLCAS